MAPDVYRALRALTLRERTASPTTARSYGRVVLDAIDMHVDVLAEYWKAPRPPAPACSVARAATLRGVGDMNKHLLASL